MSVDPMRKHRMVRQGAQPTPIAPRTALRFDALPQPGLLDELGGNLSWHRSRPATTGQRRASGSGWGLARGWWQAQATAAATTRLPATYPAVHRHPGGEPAPQEDAGDPCGHTREP